MRFTAFALGILAVTRLSGWGTRSAGFGELVEYRGDSPLNEEHTQRRVCEDAEPGDNAIQRFVLPERSPGVIDNAGRDEEGCIKQDDKRKADDSSEPVGHFRPVLRSAERNSKQNDQQEHDSREGGPTAYHGRIRFWKAEYDQ